MLVGILSCGPLPEALASEHGQYPDLYARLLDGQGFAFKSWNAYDDDFPTDPTDADAWLISGSRFGVYEDLPWIARLMDVIRTVAGSGRPMVGICFGHQAMAQALGGRVEKFSGGWALGRTAYDWGGKTRHLNAWHQDQVVAPPKGAEVLATNASCRYAALGYGPGLVSVQPHPEFDDALIAGLIDVRRSVLPADRAASALGQLGGPTDAPAVAGDLADVLKSRAAHD